jgi:hypothetical protein
MKAAARARAIDTRNDAPEPGSRLGAVLDSVFSKGSTIPGYDGDTLGHVSHTAEMRRVLALPRKPWEVDEDLVDLLTDELKTPAGTMRLRPVQAAALATLHDCRGCFAPIAVGEGKTLISFLAPVVMQAKRPVLIVPAKLKEKTRREFATLAKHWTEPASMEIVSFEWLGRVNAADFFETVDPDFVACDEAHRIRNPRAAVSRRVVRFLQANPDVPFLAMSGTMTTRSLLDFHHLLALTLGADAMPLPAPASEAKTWARAVDEKVKTRGRPGALRLMLDQDTRPSLASIREAVGRRIVETPGIVATKTPSVPASIFIDIVERDFEPETKPFVRDLRRGIAPNGDEALPADVFRHVRTLALGFFYRWDPEPPEAWLDARRDWKRFARDVLEEEEPGLDSELQIANAVRAGRLDDFGALAAWSAVRDTFRPNSVPVWLHDPKLPALVEPSIVWVEHVAAGEKIAAMLGLPYFHRLGMSSTGAFIDDHDPTKSLVASIASNSEGRNLQAWASNLIVTPPANGRTWEQLLGRTHRLGQTADTVSARVLCTPPEREHLRQAFADARYIAATTGQPQKLLAADLSVEP